ncbi:MAG TPA: carbonic anhydrase family protein [Pyrinomonadaceae bacterium]|nr:carbonic anhydrase family protein [Pyrinomonadaceae bacterium]
MRYSSAFWILFLIFASLGSVSAQKSVVQTKESQAAMTPKAALQRLKEGNARFVSGKIRDQANYRAEVLETGKYGQYPFAAFVSCIDSRVDVDNIFDLNNGDAFDARIVAGIVDAGMLGSLEYATEEAGAKLIVVLGHTHCGGIKGACDDIQLGHLTGALARIRPAVRTVAKDWKDGEMNSKNDKFVDAVMRENVKLMIKNIHLHSEVIRELEKAGKVLIVGAAYDVETGQVTFFEK